MQPDDLPPDTVPLEMPDANSLHERVQVLEKQAGDYKLLIADLENSRKRLAADAERQRKYVYEPIAKDLVGALDNLEFAIKAAELAHDSGPLVQGVKATGQQLLDILKRHGIARIEIAPGSAFDPNRHQAVMQQPAEGLPPESVASVVQHGYTIHDRVLRPASVVVVAGGDA